MVLDVARLVFVVLPLLLAGGLAWGVGAASRRLGEDAAVRRRALTITAVGAVLWMGGTWLAAASGVLRQWAATPPPFMILVLGIVHPRGGDRLHPVWRADCPRPPALGPGCHAKLRLPLELAMHEMYERGVMPVK